ncbi:MAG: M64 family metallo-endopeptidase [Candidatus Kapabacteria bacterium]|nr:M64 family metallo-endopeptidase [Candidatus Kapabacteria bacterium]
MRVFALVLILITGTLNSQIFNVDTVVNKGRFSNRLNIVYLGDGYTKNDLMKFQSDIIQLSSAFVSFEPFSHYKDFINIIRVDVISEESGVSHEQLFTETDCLNTPVMKVKNYFGTKFDAGSVHRLLGPYNYSNIFNVLTNNTPDYDLAFIVANTNYYGGSGGMFPTTSMNSGASAVLVHEFGHGFAGLGDEYSYPGSTPRETPNTTKEIRRDSIRWNHWINPATPVPTPDSGAYYGLIGLFEGAAYSPKGWYRPKYNCLMRSNGVPFCEVCAESLLMRLFDLVNPVDKYFPDSLKLDLSKKITFNLKLIKPQPNTIKVDWVLDNISIAKNIDSVIINDNLSAGKHILSASVIDTTLLIKMPAHFTKHISIVKWEINVFKSNIEINSEENRLKIQIIPNPIEEFSIIEYKLEKAGYIKLEIIDMEGRIKVLDEGFKEEGLHKYMLNSELKELIRGNYIINFESDGMNFPINVVKL